jgi:glycosyltransferase involved in cell wall biosynthesis
MKLALVHDWLTGMRGGERVLEALCELYPEAPIYTLFYFPNTVSETIERHQIFSSSLQRLPGVEKYYRYTYTLMPFAIESFDLSGYDLVISTSHRIAKGVLVSPHTCHISYIHSPMRDAWEMSKEYFGPQQMNWWKRLVIPPQLSFLRVWDILSTARVDYLIANSENIRRRILHTYQREAQVIYPPVDLSQYQLAEKKDEYYLMVGSFEPNKRVDLAIQAFNELGYLLKIVGNTGRNQRRMRELAQPNIEFLGWQDDHTVAKLYAQAKAFIFPGVDDFGITPVEAQASGTPVIAYAAGGSLETVIGGQTGVFFDEPTVESLMGAIHKAETITWDQKRLRENAERFQKSHFLSAMTEFVEKSLTEYQEQFSQKVSSDLP